MFETSQFQFINDQSHLSAHADPMHKSVYRIPPRAIRPHRQPATLSSLYSGVIPAQRRWNEIVNVHSIDLNAEEPIAAWLQDALHAFVKDSINIRSQSGVEGGDGQVESNLREGLQGNGWLIFAMANKQTENMSHGPIKDADIVGVLLVTEDKRSTKLKRSATIKVLLSHKDFLKRGVASKLWLSFKHALQNINSITLFVKGGPCMVNDDSIRFYHKRGFQRNDIETEYLELYAEYINGEVDGLFV